LNSYGLSDRRKKRFWGWIVGGIVPTVFSAGIGVGLGISYQARVDKERFDLLEAKITRLLDMDRMQDTHSVSLRESLIGYTNVTKNQIEKMKQVQSKMQNGSSLFETELKSHSKILKTLSKGDIVSNQMMIALHSETDFMRRVDHLIDHLREQVTTYEIAISQLQQGYLPPGLISMRKMRAILEHVDKNLPDGFSLFYNRDDVQQYYNLPLVTYGIIERVIYLRLVIPLRFQSVDLYAPSFSLFRPHVRPIPPPPFWNARRGRNEMKLFKMTDFEDDLWAFANSSFFAVTQKKYFRCLHRGDQSFCLSFYEKPFTTKSECINSLLTKSFERTTTNCLFKDASSEKYSPPEISEGRYFLHHGKAIRYWFECQGDSNITEIITKNLTLGFDAKIKPGCQLIVSHEMSSHMRPGRMPFSVVENTTLSPSFNFRTVNYSEPISLVVPSDESNLSQEKLFEVEVENYDENENMREIVSRWRRETEEIRERINQTDKFIVEYERKFTAWDAMSSFEDLILDLVVLYLAMIYIRNGHWAIFGPAAVNVITPVNAYDFANTFHETIESHLITDFSFANLVMHYITFVKVILILACFGIFLCRSSFYRVSMSMHHGTVIRQLSGCRFWIELSFVVQKDRMTHTHKHLVVLRVPVEKDQEIPSHTSHCLVMEPICLWFTRNRYEHLSVASELEIRGLNSDGKYSVVLQKIPPLLIEWNNIEWDDDFPPFNFFLRNDHGQGNLRIIPDPSPVYIPLRPTRPRRPAPSSPPPEYV